MNLKRLLQCIKELYLRFYEDEIPALAAEFAYYLLLSFFPFLIFLMNLIGRTSIPVEAVIGELANVLPTETYQLIRKNLLELISNTNKGLISFSFITTLWAASNGMRALIHGLNKAYNVKERRPFWYGRIMAVLFTGAVVLIIILSLILLVFGRQIGLYLAYRLGLSEYFSMLWDVIRIVFMLFIMISIFATIYKYGPNCKLQWKEVLLGASFTSVGWIIASFAFSYYINNFANYSKVYGSIGGIVILLLWLYLSAIIILLGGELNEILTISKDANRVG